MSKRPFYAGYNGYKGDDGMFLRKDCLPGLPCSKWIRSQISIGYFHVDGNISTGTQPFYTAALDAIHIKSRKQIQNGPVALQEHFRDA